ncbi:uncharacterized protein SYNPCC7002_A1628-like isoform X2 [Ostrea edulis]|uniref:uncharacterized protein SYNPCC7002_A1628-like isoform X2 n=1 Tax=Ostrea edulis TaxID=37623 RepID=UPI0020944190|nr:uncharacterized protein SYNPCC7002_A1628-like isoform X2 [Ostrea edulis]
MRISHCRGSVPNLIKRMEVHGLPIVHHDGYVCEFPIKHRFAMRKFHGVLRHLRTDNVISMKQIIQPTAIHPDLLKCVHTPDYIDRFIGGKITVKEQRLTGFEWSPGIVSRCRLETGGTLLAGRIAIEHGIACSTGGGTHHAFPSHGAGYCLLNDMAVTAAVLFKECLVQKVLIVDLDVHQGDGTAFIFSDSCAVFTFSMHCEKNYPHQKQTSDMDIGLVTGISDKDYLEHLQSYLPWLLDSFKPDLVLYDAGVDPHEKDELGKLNLTDKGLFQRDWFVIDSCVSRGIPVATVIGGGYDRDVNRLALRHTIVHRAATQVWHSRISSR